MAEIITGAANQLTFPSQASTMMDVIARAAGDPAVDVGKMEKLLAMQERLQDKDAERQYNKAMILTQMGIRPVAPDLSNPQTRSKYASYFALDAVLRPIYSQGGFALTFDTGDGAPENYVRVLCHVLHESGHSKTFHVDMPADGKGAKGNDVMTKTHAVGSAMTYGARYLLKFIFNVAIGEDDDDGNAAGNSTAVKYITDGQVLAIQDLIDKAQADIEKFCAFMNVTALARIKAADYQNAVDALGAAIAKKNKAKP